MRSIAKWVVGIAMAMLVFAPGCYDSGRARFPFEELRVESGSLSSSLAYNPFSNYPPKVRWEIGVTFEKIQPPGAEKADSTFISYTVDLGFSNWKKLPGVHELSSNGGSDMWIDGVNYGLVDLQRVTIKPSGRRSYQITLDLVFNFEGVPFRRERKQVSFRTHYDGLYFSPPQWGDPTKAKFPAPWKVPSAEPFWPESEVRIFVSRYIDLSTFREVSITQDHSRIALKAKP